MMRHTCRGMIVLAAGLALLWAGAARAGEYPSDSSEQKCQFKRAKEKAKYEKCVGYWISKLYAGKLNLNPADPLGLVPAEEKLAKCRVKYQETWPKLQKLTGTTCDAPRFVDNGDGTVTDNLTGLTWEQKDSLDDVEDLDNRHDADNHYTWTVETEPDYSDEDGTVFTDFLANLNSSAFGGAVGWRLPTFAELQTILLPEQYPCDLPVEPAPCIDDLFGPTKLNYYWSSSTDAAQVLPDPPGCVQCDFWYAWTVEFNSGRADGNDKDAGYFARAVRGGW